MNLINIGFGSLVCYDKIISVLSPESAPIKRIIQDARERYQLIDATYGKRTKSVIIMQTDHVILSSLNPQSIVLRVDNGKLEEDL